MDAAGIDAERRAGALTPGGAGQGRDGATGRHPDLLLDEPLAELDPLARRRVMGVVIADVEEACDHLVLLREGRVRVAGPVDALLDEHRLLLAHPNRVDGHLPLGMTRFGPLWGSAIRS
ncbi:hypothetical protein WEH80_20165 [Actinomycetes bacterium KLBMP 9759]